MWQVTPWKLWETQLRFDTRLSWTCMNAGVFQRKYSICWNWILKKLRFHYKQCITGIYGCNTNSNTNTILAILPKLSKFSLPVCQCGHARATRGLNSAWIPPQRLRPPFLFFFLSRIPTLVVRGRVDMAVSVFCQAQWSWCAVDNHCRPLWAPLCQRRQKRLLHYSRRGVTQ